MTDNPVALSTLELDVVWEAEGLGPRHVALGVPSPGTTHAERAEFVDKAWAALEARGLARDQRIAGALLDQLGVLANPQRCVDVWLWADHPVHGLAASSGNDAVLGLVDGDEFWLIPARADTLVESAVSVAGELPAGVGQSVTLPHALLTDAAVRARGDAHALVGALQDRGLDLFSAQELAGMLLGTVAKGQFGAERVTRSGVRERASHVVACHDTDAGRYLMVVERAGDGEDWCTVAPADNALLAERVWELLLDTDPAR
ncbi:ESX secretion-associated protein EspG [Haloechinothrix salitolerans]|uniref:ESX secretion-associated protein EspG n=1 Tax=Haloechinothrix salitolerans TaxID=926830 RepID=A0ABW2BUI9_9PSEU